MPALNQPVAATAAQITTGTSIQRTVNKLFDIIEPVVDFLLWPLKWVINRLMAYINRRFARQAPAPGVIHKPIVDRPSNLVLYVP